MYDINELMSCWIFFILPISSWKIIVKLERFVNILHPSASHFYVTHYSDFTLISDISSSNWNGNISKSRNTSRSIKADMRRFVINCGMKMKAEKIPLLRVLFQQWICWVAWDVLVICLRVQEDMGGPAQVSPI